MISKKINWGLSVILIVMTISVVTFLWKKTGEIKDDYFKYGKEFNRIRDSLGVPEIKQDWITYESDSTLDIGGMQNAE